MAPSSGDLFADAQRAWGQVFQGFVIRPDDPLNKTVLVRGRAPQGWDYVLLVATPAIMCLVNYEDQLPPVLRAFTIAAFRSVPGTPS